MLIEILFYGLIFISGLFIGSFLNVVSDRLEKGGSIVNGRSKCEFCKKELGPSDLIPVISYLFLQGKCRYCAHRLSLYYPLSEILTGSAFLIFARWLSLTTNPAIGNWVLFFYFAVLSCFLIILFLSDIKYMMVYDKVVVPAIVFVALSSILSVFYFAYSLYSQLNADTFGKYLLKAGYWKGHVLISVYQLGYTFLVALAISAFFLFLIFITKGRGMGGGDVKLGFLIGLINGFPNAITAIFIGFLLGAIYAIFLVITRKKEMKDIIAFGPFLIAGTFITIFFGNQILEWYVKLL